ncbi:MAG: endonuclease/exonuclease/phosphatase family protein [Armatimonadetes bacterium]|nr:endonuclease/exonuclease/phosphatase family protein [Armatimonadota bacterium]
MAATWGVREFIGERHPAGCLIALAPQWVWCVTPLALLVWTGFARQFGLLALNAGVLVFAAVVLGGFAVATGSPHSDAQRSFPLRVVTWNVLGHRTHKNPGAIISELNAVCPDVICLQESGFGSFHRYGEGWHRAGRNDLRVMSRFPLAEIPLDGGECEGVAAYLLQTPVGPLVLMNVHFRVTAAGSQELIPDAGEFSRYLLDSSRLRAAHVRHVLSHLPSDLPVVVCGDMNLPPTSATYRMLSQRLTDAFAATRFGFGLTYLAKGRVPAWRIDYVWCGNGVRPVWARTSSSGPSDHRPVVADLLVGG